MKQIINKKLLKKIYCAIHSIRKPGSPHHMSSVMKEMTEYVQGISAEEGDRYDGSSEVAVKLLPLCIYGIHLQATPIMHKR